MNPTATLNALQAAEARIAGTIQQTALAVDGIGSNTQQALAQLALALDNARARLAADLTTFAEMMGEAFASFDAAAHLIAAPLAIPAPVLPAQLARDLSDLDKPSAAHAPVVEPARPVVTIEVDPSAPASAIAAFVDSLQNATPDIEETVTTAELVRRGVLSQAEADDIARQAEKFTAAANPPGESADQRRRRSAPQKSGGRTKRPGATPTPGNGSVT